jgi:O-acetyl-ADP-ribose deacetylase (regulator of RNase III)
MIEIEVMQGDITKLAVDAIVNAANCSLLGGGGVDGAIHRAAGPELLKACIPLNGCETGKAKITPGFKLPAKFVIHTPGPIYRDGQHGEPALLESCYKSCLALAEENGCETVAFPAISTGVYGYPWKDATEIAVKTVRKFSTKKVKKVIFCCFSSEMERIYREVSAKNMSVLEKSLDELNSGKVVVKTMAELEAMENG